MQTTLEMVAQIWAITDPQCAGVLQMQAPAIAMFWSDRARQSTKWASAIESVVGGGGVVGGVMAHAPLLIAVAMHHGPQARAGGQLRAVPDQETPATGGYGPPAPPGSVAAESEFMGAPMGSRVSDPIPTDDGESGGGSAVPGA